MAKRKVRLRRSCWLLPLLYAMPILCAAAAALLLWGERLQELIGIVVKLAVIA